MVQGRHQVKIRDALRRDVSQHRRGIEARHAHEKAVGECRGQQGTHAHRVIQRHDAKRAFTARIQVLRHVRYGGGAFMAMAARHALGLAGRARRIQHQREIVSARAQQWGQRLGFQQFVKPVRVPRRITHRNARQRRGGR